MNKKKLSKSMINGKENTQKFRELDMSTPLKVAYTRCQADREMGYKNETLASLLTHMRYGNDELEHIGGIMIDVSKLLEAEKLNEQDAGREM